MNLFKYLRGRLRSRSLRHHDFSIISNNCWGAFVYQDFGLKYCTPFVGLYLYAPDYLKLLKNLRPYMEAPLEFIDPARSTYVEDVRKNGTLGRYPVGRLNDVEIHFLHYRTPEEATRKWEARTRRINWRKLIVKYCDRDLCTYELLRQFDALPYPNKLGFTAREYKEFKSCVHLAACAGAPCVDAEQIHYKNHLDILSYLNGLVVTES
jgi:uncharacterized protein (DUF1919 family)